MSRLMKKINTSMKGIRHKFLASLAVKMVEVWEM
jgi:hypothetical protein